MRLVPPATEPSLENQTAAIKTVFSFRPSGRLGGGTPMLLTAEIIRVLYLKYYLKYLYPQEFLEDLPPLKGSLLNFLQVRSLQIGYLRLIGRWMEFARLTEKLAYSPLSMAVWK
jgi:hypothetical protein